MSDYEMADCLSNLLHLNNQSTDLFDTMNAEDACNTLISPFHLLCSRTTFSVQVNLLRINCPNK